MRSTAQNTQEVFAHTANDNAAAELLIFSQNQLIAQQAEVACHLEGNLNSPDFDSFEETYGLACFA